LNGPFEVRDSINEIIVKGNFKDDLKDGEWLQRYRDKDFNDENYFIYQKGNYLEGKRDGKWIQYYIEGKTAATFNYKLGELHGEYILWNHFNKPSEKKQFNNGKLTALTTYDSLGGNLINKYEIYDENYNSYKCRKTEFYSDNTSSSQEYWVKKEKDIDHNWFELNFLIAIEKTFSDETKGHKEGEFRLFNSNNQPIVTGKFYKEDRIGLWTFYYYDQNVKIESNFTADKRVDEKYLNLNGGLFSGEFVYFDNDNGIKEERKIKDGFRNGKTVYSYTKTKRTIKKEIYKNGVLK
jgi:antitoxin component YwqK of YwqJK toxin-antitoxin module